MLKVKKLALGDRAYGYTKYCGFGDMWAVTSYLLRLSEESKKPTQFWSQSARQTDMIKLIVPFLRSKGTISFVPPTSKIKMVEYCEPFRVKFVPTYKRWEYDKCSKLVAYQFDGNHLADIKNLPLLSLKYLLQSLEAMGYQTVNVGENKPLSYIIDVLSQCKFFVGCASGLSIASISVGNPVFLITRMINPLFLKFMMDCQYRTKHVQMFSTTDEFLIYLRRINRCGMML
jgi:hypothetical protein